MLTDGVADGCGSHESLEFITCFRVVSSLISASSEAKRGCRVLEVLWGASNRIEQNGENRKKLLAQHSVKSSWLAVTYKFVNENI